RRATAALLRGWQACALRGPLHGSCVLPGAPHLSHRERGDRAMSAGVDPHSRAEQEESDTAAMFYRMSASRLRSRCIWAAVALVASFLVPYEIIGGRGVFVWSVLPELDPAA